MNLLSSIWNYKCPRCRKGDLFVAPFSMQNPLNMNKKCAHCELDFENEPGYYFGALFISSIWTICACFAIVGFCMLVLGWSLEASFGLLIVISILTYFFIVRISRSMFIHMDVRYDKELAAAPSKSHNNTTEQI